MREFLKEMWERQPDVIFAVIGCVVCLFMVIFGVTMATIDKVIENAHKYAIQELKYKGCSK